MMPEERRVPLVSRLPFGAGERGAILAAHDQALAAGEPTYLDPRTGLVVLTAAALWDRGSCCRSGCRHCPFAPGRRAERT